MKTYVVFVMNLLIFSFLLVGCEKCKTSPEEKAVNRVLARNSEALAKKYKMFPIATTISMPHRDIRYLALEFKICGPLSKDELRKILIYSVQDFLYDLNSDPEFSSYLKKHYLTIKDIGITLFIVDSSGRDLDDPYIGIAKISKGKLQYDILITVYDPDIKKNIPELTSKSEEFYEEALDIINNNKC